MVIAVFLSLVGALMLYYAALKIAKEHITQIRYAILIAAIVSVIVKEVLYHVTKNAAVKYHSTILYANAWHHRSDALSSIAVVIGFFAMKMGYRYGDHLAAIAVGLMIIIIAVRILGKCFGELGERSVDKETIEHIKNIINSNEQIRHWHKLRTRTIAREIFLDLHILVDTDLNITQAHDIAEHLENTLHEQLSRPVNIMVHIEPDIPELRKIKPVK
jgi:cation diffusion facilitator family transporter